MDRRTKPPTSARSKRWKTSTGSSIPRSAANRSLNSLPASICVRPRTFCSSARPASAKRTWPKPSGYEAIKQGKEVLYRSIFDLVRDFMKDEAFKQQDQTLRRYLKPDLVIIDDMGLKQLPKQSGEYLLEVVMRRYENRSTIMTSNRPLEDWGKLLSDVPTAGAILDRFLHHAITIAITGRSYRIKDSLPPAPQKPEKAESQRTFRRRVRELRLTARPRLVLPTSRTPLEQNQKTVMNPSPQTGRF